VAAVPAINLTRTMSNDLGVIFDMDGVLIDSYQVHFESWRKLGAEYDRFVSEAEFAETFGRTSREIIESLWKAHWKSEADILAMDRRKEALFREIAQQDFPAMRGASALLASLENAGFALAVGSSAPPENVALALDRLHARGLFRAVVTGGDVTRGKPDPQVYLIAAERLGVPPNKCVVVEDAPVGIAAGQAAGMKCIGFASSGHTRDSLSTADVVIDSLDELSPEVLAALIRGKVGRVE
jgi:beta-phosphoglucomutase